MFWQKRNALRLNPKALALGVKDIAVLLSAEAGGSIRKRVDVSRNPLGDPHKLVLDLGGSHEPGHLKANLVAGSAVGKQVERYLVVRLTQNLSFLPGMSSDMAGDHMADGLQVADVEVDELWRRRATPVLICVEIKSGKAGKSTLPASTRGVHGEDDV